MSSPLVDPDARLQYAGDLLGEVEGAPWPLLERWYAEAVADDRVVEPGAMVVATVDAEGVPDARTVLLKQLDPSGFVFYSSSGSAKGAQLAGQPHAAVVLLWHPMFRQVRARGRVERTTPDEAAAYFAHRPRGSQVATRASRQSQPLADRADLERAVAAEEARWPDTGSPTDVPPPEAWTGYRVVPEVVELWVGRQSRLHDRVAFRRTGDGDLADPASWRAERLQP
ncbi:pyridoxamine 5'-phosphate oxidase [Angustibacter aerolatus]